MSSEPEHNEGNSDGKYNDTGKSVPGHKAGQTDNQSKPDNGQLNHGLHHFFCWFHADNIYLTFVSGNCTGYWPPQYFSYGSMMKWSVMPAM